MTCIGGTLVQNRFADFLLIILLLVMPLWEPNTTPFRQFSLKNKNIEKHWWDLNTKPFRQFFAKINTYGHACIGGTLTPNRCADIWLIKILMDMHW